MVGWVNDEMERMGKEAITIYFKTLSRRGKTEENYAKLKSRQQVS
jgi:hypothetical protein